VSQAAAISGLKKLMKEPIISVDPGDHVQHLIDESPRSSIILHGALIEEMLVDRLERLMPSINSEERARLFQFEGPLGSFSNRIRMAQAFEIIDRPTRKRVELIKEMRNAAAHCHARIDFKTPQIRTAVAALFGKEPRVFDDWDIKSISGLFSVAVNSLAYVLTHPETEMSWDNLWANGSEVAEKRRKRAQKRRDKRK